MGKKNVYLSAGHSGCTESGVKSEWLNEKVEARSLRDLVYDKCRSLISMKKSTDGITLGERVKEDNKFCGKGSGVAIEIHFNAGGGSGALCTVSNNASVMSRKVVSRPSIWFTSEKT